MTESAGNVDALESCSDDWNTTASRDDRLGWNEHLTVFQQSIDTNRTRYCEQSKYAFVSVCWCVYYGTTNNPPH